MTKREHLERARLWGSLPDDYTYPYYHCSVWLEISNGALSLYHYLLAYAPDGVQEET